MNICDRSLKIKILCFLNLTVFGEKAKESDVFIKEANATDSESYIKIAQLPEVRSQHYGTRNSPAINKQVAVNLWKNNKHQSLPCYRIHMIYYRGNVVGYLSFFPDENNSAVVYIAYSVDPKYWNNGIATIAVKNLIGLYRETLKYKGIKKICATIKINNFGSIRVLEKNGFIIKNDIYCNNFPAKLLELKI